LLDFLHYAHLHLDAGRAVTSIFIDFSKAFDTVDHNLILKKLFLLDADPVLLLWVTSFLDHRTQRTRFKGADSEIVTLSCGVPQGTVLGPFLFSVMVGEDIQDQDYVQTFKYVDDKTLAVSHSKTSLPCLQESLNQQQTWVDANNMKLNPTKCSMIQFCFSKTSPPEPGLHISGAPLVGQGSVRLLGLVIQSTLSWKDNTTLIVSKASRRLFMLKILKFFGASKEDLMLTWTTYIRGGCR
jgi:hypothetical protein